MLPGDGIVVVVDGARFLPACTTVSRCANQHGKAGKPLNVSVAWGFAGCNYYCTALY
jgi:hypothetical protein